MGLASRSPIVSIVPILVHNKYLVVVDRVWSLRLMRRVHSWNRRNSPGYSQEQSGGANNRVEPASKVFLALGLLANRKFRKLASCTVSFHQPFSILPYWFNLYINISIRIEYLMIDLIFFSAVHLLIHSNLNGLESTMRGADKKITEVESISSEFFNLFRIIRNKSFV